MSPRASIDDLLKSVASSVSDQEIDSAQASARRLQEDPVPQEFLGFRMFAVPKDE